MTIPQQELDSRQIRLSDRILCALELALDQNDVTLSELLASALEMALTRKTGGAGFVERRDFPPEIERSLDRLSTLKNKKAS